MTQQPRPVERPPLTWIAQISKDLERTLQDQKIKTPLTKESLQKIKILADDRSLWKEIVSMNKDSNI